jgi:hypothetical protein
VSLRKAVRYPLDAPVTFSWKDEHGIGQESDGFTRDISMNGAYVFAYRCPPLGVPLGLSIHLPALPQSVGAVMIQSEARVVRVENTDGGGRRTGFAVCNQSVVMKEGSDGDGKPNQHVVNTTTGKAARSKSPGGSHEA